MQSPDLAAAEANLAAAEAIGIKEWMVTAVACIAGGIAGLVFITGLVILLLALL